MHKIHKNALFLSTRPTLLSGCITFLSTKTKNFLGEGLCWKGATRPVLTF